MAPPVETPVFSTATAFGDAIDSINTAIADTPAGDVPDLLLEEIPECVSIVQDESQEPAMPSQVAIMPVSVELDEDPFKVSVSWYHSGQLLIIFTKGPYRCLEA